MLGGRVSGIPEAHWPASLAVSKDKAASVLRKDTLTFEDMDKHTDTHTIHIHTHTTHTHRMSRHFLFYKQSLE